MNLSKFLAITGVFIVTSFSASLASRAGETFIPPLPPKVIELVHLPANVERGLVRLRLSIDKSGHPRKIATLSVCNPLVETRVVNAVAKWQFSPATENGQPVDAEIILPLQLRELSGPHKIPL